MPLPRTRLLRARCKGTRHRSGRCPRVTRSYSACIPLVFRLYSACIPLVLLDRILAAFGGLLLPFGRISLAPWCRKRTRSGIPPDPVPNPSPPYYTFATPVRLHRLWRFIARQPGTDARPARRRLRKPARCMPRPGRSYLQSAASPVSWLCGQRVFCGGALARRL
jgi:hypothetical protein